jgi:hypothetical protein
MSKNRFLHSDKLYHDHREFGDITRSNAYKQRHFTSYESEKEILLVKEQTSFSVWIIPYPRIELVEMGSSMDCH